MIIPVFSPERPMAYILGPEEGALTIEHTSMPLSNTTPFEAVFPDVIILVIPELSPK